MRMSYFCSQDLLPSFGLNRQLMETETGASFESYSGPVEYFRPRVEYRSSRIRVQQVSTPWEDGVAHRAADSTILIYECRDGDSPTLSRHGPLLSLYDRCVVYRLHGSAFQ